MKKRLVTILLAVSMVSALTVTGCSGNSTKETTAVKESSAENEEQKAADEVAALIDTIYVQKRTDDTD